MTNPRPEAQQGCCTSCGITQLACCRAAIFLVRFGPASTSRLNLLHSGYHSGLVYAERYMFNRMNMLWHDTTILN